MILTSALIAILTVVGMDQATSPQEASVVEAPPTSQERAETAELLDRVVKTYQSIERYEDTGTETRVYTGDVQRTRTQTFLTRFQRPNQLLHDVDEATDGLSARAAIWTGDGKPKTWSAISEMTTPYTNLLTALRESAERSAGSVGYVPVVLVDPDLKQSLFRKLIDGKVQPDESIESVECRRIEWRNPHTTMDPFPGVPFGKRRVESLSAWFGKDDLLVRRVVETQVITGKKKDGSPMEFEEVSTISYAPNSKPTFGDKAFKFSPPRTPDTLMFPPAKPVRSKP